MRKFAELHWASEGDGLPYDPYDPYAFWPSGGGPPCGGMPSPNEGAIGARHASPQTQQTKARANNGLD